MVVVGPVVKCTGSPAAHVFLPAESANYPVAASCTGAGNSELD